MSVRPSRGRALRSISVLMPTWQGAEFLERVLERLSQQRCDIPWDFLAIDSGSTDGTLEILERWKSKLGVPLRVEHVHQSAFDHGDTRNLLAAQSEGDLLVFLTQDAIPSGPEWLATLARNFDDANVGAAYCRNVPRPDAALLTRLFSANDPGYSAGRRETRIADDAEYAALGPHERRLLYNFNDVASAIPRELWELHPLPRTSFGEDVLMARALLEAGWTVVYDDVATVEHSHDYGPAEMRKRAEVDGRFNAEWLGRLCVASEAEARALVDRQLEVDRKALVEAGLADAELARELALAKALREAAFFGMHAGGKSERRRPATRLLETPKRRVLYVVHGFPPETWAGTEVYTLGLAQEMQRRGHEVAVLTRVPDANEVEQGGAPDFSVAESEFAGLRVFRMTNRTRHRSIRESYLEPRADAAFRRVLARFRPDVVHFQHLIHLSVGLPAVCRELGIPSLITVNDYWPLCARVQLIRPDGVRCEESQGLGCLYCIKGDEYAYVPHAKVVLPTLAPLVEQVEKRPMPGLWPLQHHVSEYRDVEARLGIACGGYATCDLAIAPSRFLREKLLATGHFEPHRVLYSDYGTLTDRVRPLARKRKANAPLRLGFVGSLLWYKGVDVLLRAMAQLGERKVTLHVFGDFKPESDEYHKKLAELAQACGERVQFHGRFDNDRVADVYEQFDALVVPSTWFENSPITIHEAFLFRTPVIASDIGGMAELVEHGRNGLQFRVGDAESLAGAIARLCDEPGMLERLDQFPHVKTMAEDAREMEARYRALGCIVRERTPQRPLDAAGNDALARGGPVDAQFGSQALLRPGGEAWIEFDIGTAGAGAFTLELELVTLAGEERALFGGRILIDGEQVAEIPLHSGASERQLERQRFELELEGAPQRLRIDNLSSSPHAWLRVARVRLFERRAEGASVA